LSSKEPLCFISANTAKAAAEGKMAKELIRLTLNEEGELSNNFKGKKDCVYVEKLWVPIVIPGDEEHLILERMPKGANAYLQGRHYYIGIDCTIKQGNSIVCSDHIEEKESFSKSFIPVMYFKIER